MNANPEHQLVLLDIADIDRRIAQATHAKANPTQAARISELAAQRQQQVRELTVKAGARDDAQTELRRIEGDVALAEQRRARNADRLATATNAKDAVALEQEIASLGQRLSVLEDAQLAAMGAVEDAEAAVAAQQALIDSTTAEGTELTRQAKADIAAADAMLAQLARDREAVSEGTQPSLLMEYDRRAARGVGAALLRAGACGGCMMLLSSTDLNEIRRMPADQVASCPECNCILVRTDESGLS